MKRSAAASPEGPPTTQAAAQPAAGDVALSERLAALADPLSLRLLRVLEAEELSVGEVAKVMQLPQSTVSRRLKVLGDAGWLSKRAEGTASFYRLLLDDLPSGAREIWIAVRAQMGGAALAAQLRVDAQRLVAVLAERATDSLGYFGRVAGEWDSIRAELFGVDFTARALLGLLTAEWVVADLGCGTGNASEHLAPFVKKVIAVDQSAPMLKAARKRLHARENVEFVKGELTALPLADASVDGAVFALVLHHVERPSEALAEARRILRPGGVALVIDMQEHERKLYRTTMGHRHLGFSERRMQEEMKAAGLAQGRFIPLADAPEGKGPGLFAATGIRPRM